MRSSTGGFGTYIKGPSTSCLVYWNSFKLPNVVLSSMEGEVSSIQVATKSAIHAKMLADLMLGIEMPLNNGLYESGTPMVMRADALSAIKSIKKAFSTRVRHMRRTLGISISWLNRTWSERHGSWLVHHPGRFLAADSMTKALDRELLRRHERAMGVVT